MKMRSFLLNNVLPFWAKNAIDREFGGIITMLDRDGKIYGTDKNVWFMGRAMYTYALAYNELEKKQEYLDIAKEMYRFLSKCELDESGRLPFIVARDGRPLLFFGYEFVQGFSLFGAKRVVCLGISQCDHQAHRAV